MNAQAQSGSARELQPWETICPSCGTTQVIRKKDRRVARHCAKGGDLCPGSETVTVNGNFSFGDL